MPAVPLSSAEMLEQEYEYFHGPLGDLEWRFVAGDACDASADRKYAFGDLANAVCKIRVDFGVPIEFLSAIYIGPQEQGRLGKYCALANIRYDLVDGDVKPGRLLRTMRRRATASRTRAPRISSSPSRSSRVIGRWEDTWWTRW